MVCHGQRPDMNQHKVQPCEIPHVPTHDASILTLECRVGFANALLFKLPITDIGFGADAYRQQYFLKEQR